MSTDSFARRHDAWMHGKTKVVPVMVSEVMVTPSHKDESHVKA